MGDAPVLSHCSFAKKFLTKTNWGAGALSWSRNQLLVPQFLGHLLWPYPWADEGVDVHFVIHSSNSFKLYQQILGTFWSYYIPTLTGCHWLQMFNVTCVISRIHVKPLVAAETVLQLVRRHLAHPQGLSHMSLQKSLPQLMLRLKYIHHCQVSNTSSSHISNHTDFRVS